VKPFTSARGTTHDTACGAGRCRRRRGRAGRQRHRGIPGPHGLDVVLLEKATFPRDKICGDGLTPRAVRELVHLGIDTTGWQRTRGLRILGGGQLHPRLAESATFPAYGMVRTRAVRRRPRPARPARGARLHEGTSVTAPMLDGAGRVTGVSRPSVLDEAGARHRRDRAYRAKVVVAADGVSSRLATAVGREKREDRVMGVAVRAYYTTPRQDDYLESPPRAVDHRRRRRPDPDARLRLALPARGRPHQCRPGHPRHLQRLRQDRLQGRHASLGRGPRRPTGI
jgi:2-polyprenyl-6-methoxyphenol hydroxylase-like FAD-dependent oxidoreductase